jgi:hypothetical protein
VSLLPTLSPFVADLLIIAEYLGTASRYFLNNGIKLIPQTEFQIDFCKGFDSLKSILPIAAKLLTNGIGDFAVTESPSIIGLPERRFFSLGEH